MNRAQRRAHRERKIVAMSRYMRDVMKMNPTHKVVAIKATHPKCDCWMCKEGRYDHNLRMDAIVEARMKIEMPHLFDATDGINVFYKRFK